MASFFHYLKKKLTQNVYTIIFNKCPLLWRCEINFYLSNCEPEIVQFIIMPHFCLRTMPNFLLVRSKRLQNIKMKRRALKLPNHRNLKNSGNSKQIRCLNFPIGFFFGPSFGFTFTIGLEKYRISIRYSSFTQLLKIALAHLFQLEAINRKISGILKHLKA